MHGGCNRSAAFEALRAYPGGLQLGGGVTSDNAGEYLDAGASHVIVTSYVFREGRLDEERLRELVRAPASVKSRDGQHHVDLTSIVALAVNDIKAHRQQCLSLTMVCTHTGSTTSGCCCL